MVRNQPRELDLMRQQQRLLACRGDGFHLHGRVVGAERDDEPVRRAAAERNGHPMARNDVEAFRHRVAVSLPVEGARRQPHAEAQRASETQRNFCHRGTENPEIKKREIF